MLSIYFGRMDNELRIADGWFNNQSPEECYTTDFSKRVVKKIDNSEILSNNTVDSPVLGIIPITGVSSNKLLYRRSGKYVDEIMEEYR